MLVNELDAGIPLEVVSLSKKSCIVGYIVIIDFACDLFMEI